MLLHYMFNKDDGFATLSERLHPESLHSAPNYGPDTIVLKPESKTNFWKSNRNKTLGQYARFRRKLRGWRVTKVTLRFLFRVSGLLLNGFEVRFSLKYSQVIGGEGCCRNQKRKQRLIEDTSNLFGTSQSEKENWRLNGTD